MTSDQRALQIQVAMVDGLTPELGITFVVEQAWLPMVVLSGVKAVVQGRQSISMMERFVLEALLRLETLELHELQEIASIPPELGAWLLGSLRQRGLVRDAGAAFAPDTGRCVAALESGELPVERLERRDLLWFPETDEVVALKSATEVLRTLRRLAPCGSWPMPLGWRGKTRAALLDEPLSARRFYGDAAADIVAIQDDTVVQGEQLPAYRCSAATALDGRAGSWRLELWGVTHKKRESDGTRETISIPLPVPPLPIVIAGWRQRMLDARTQVASVLQRELGFSVGPDGSAGFSASLSAPEASRLAQDRLLSELFGLRVRIDDEFQCLVPLRCSPADDAAAHVFAIDHMTRTVLSENRAYPEADGVSRRDVLGRLWQLRFFKPLYDLREAADFSP